MIELRSRLPGRSSPWRLWSTWVLRGLARRRSLGLRIALHGPAASRPQCRRASRKHRAVLGPGHALSAPGCGRAGVPEKDDRTFGNGRELVGTGSGSPRLADLRAPKGPLASTTLLDSLRTDVGLVFLGYDPVASLTSGDQRTPSPEKNMLTRRGARPSHPDVGEQEDPSVGREIRSPLRTVQPLSSVGPDYICT